MSDADRIVDALGTYCPVPIALAARAARELSAGAIIELLADDPLIEVDLPAWCHRSGHELISLAHDEGGYRAHVRCRAT